nr:MAG TPA: hypothetical protein [Caudoviricetes sp.]
MGGARTPHARRRARDPGPPPGARQSTEGMTVGWPRRQGLSCRRDQEF